MTLQNEHIIIEKAKNGLFTCRMQKENKWSYLYSKYKPQSTIDITTLQKDRSTLLLSLGLGYELNEIVKNTVHPILVIEKHPLFYNFFSQHSPFKELINDPRITFFIGDDFKTKLLPIMQYQIIHSPSLSFDSDFYQEVMSTVSKRIHSGQKKILFFSHVTIADDCIYTLRGMGYHVIATDPLPTKQLIKKIQDESIDYLFSINPRKLALEALEHLDIPYIAWVVDSPSTRLYSKDLLSFKNFHIFHYDPEEANELKRRGLPNVEYLPVAANIARFDQMEISEEERLKYTSDVSFVGNSGYENEYNSLGFEQDLSRLTKEAVLELFSTQMQVKDRFIIKEKLSNELSKKIEREIGLQQPSSEAPFFFY
jgi:hypothetical protein